MEEYEVRDVSRRLHAPDLVISFRLTDPAPVLLSFTGSPAQSQALGVLVVVGNSSPAPADFCLLSYFVDFRMRPTYHSSSQPDNVVDVGSTSIPVCSQFVEWRGNLRLPIWETMTYQVGAFSVHLTREAESFFLFWEAHAPLMMPKRGSYALTVASDRASISPLETPWQLTNRPILRV